MLSTLRSRLKNEDDGFTLIELMVVVLIIAILIAIAIPTFLGAQNKAKDRSAQSDIRNAITTVRTLATDSSGIINEDTVNVALLKEAEPNIAFNEVVDADARAISVVVDEAAGHVKMYTESDSGKWYGAATDETGKIVNCDEGSEAIAKACSTTAAAPEAAG